MSRARTASIAVGVAVVLGSTSCSGATSAPVHRTTTAVTTPGLSRQSPSATPTPTYRPAKGQTVAHSFNGSPRVGTLFLPHFYPGLHFCTASVVQSSGHDVIMTAAHCMGIGTGRGYAFVPEYHNKKAPYGVWHTTGAYAAASWITNDGNTRRDFTFLTVAPRRLHGKLRQIQDVVGGNRLASATAGQAVQITGYPLGVGGRPITCRTMVFDHDGYPGSHCFGFRDGTSGGPWISGTGNSASVVGLISGLHQGGCTPKLVYSTPLGASAQAILRNAEHRRHPVTFGDRPSDGCAAPNQ